MATTKTSGKVATNLLGRRVTPSPMVVRDGRNDLWWGKSGQERGRLVRTRGASRDRRDPVQVIERVEVLQGGF